jgi:amino acid transporter
MDGKIVFRVLAAIVLVAAIAGIAFFAYNAGVAAQLPAQAGAGSQPPVPTYAYPLWHPFSFFGFGCFAPLFALLLLFLAFRAFSFMLWGPRWGWGSRRHAWRHGWTEEGGVPSMFREWHDRAHGQPSQPGETKHD